jgi:hypothetical protein
MIMGCLKIVVLVEAAASVVVAPGFYSVWNHTHPHTRGSVCYKPEGRGFETR